ncbi:hypothetical protein YC2023_106503 [Brassica napus]
MSESIKVIVSLFLVVLLALAATQTESRYINYHALHGDHSLICDKAHPNTCKKEEANPYTRGCETIDRCRGQSLGPKIEIDPPQLKFIPLSIYKCFHLIKRINSMPSSSSISNSLCDSEF